MVMTWIFTLMVSISIVFAIFCGTGSDLAASVTAGAQAGINLAVSIAGSICLWSGIGKLLEKCRITAHLARLLQPLLFRVFPSTREDPLLAGNISANILANFFGLGNAATPMGIKAVARLKDPNDPGVATDEMCRLIVLNTASIQFIPSTVAAVRASLGCSSPFDILPAVWITSLCSAGLGVVAAIVMGKVLRHD